MSFQKYDYLHGGKNLYLTCEDWNEIIVPFVPTTSTSCFQYILENDNRISSLFNHIYFKYTTLDEEGNEVEQVEDCGVSILDIERDFLAYYGLRPMVKPFYPENETKTSTSVVKMASIVNEVLDMNFYKYAKLIETMGYSYNPIENYNMVESGNDTKSELGGETLTHQVDNTKTGSVEVVGPVSSVTAGAPSSTTGVKTVDFSYQLGAKLGTTTDAVTDTEAGQATGGTPSSPSSVNGITPRQDQYSTTYDSTAGRLESYTQTQGTTAQVTKSNVETDNPVTAKIINGAPGHPSYDDTKTFDDRETDTVHNLTRSGNIGVTTSQQMIESQRNLIRFSVLKEFFKDLEKELLLGTWV